MRMTPIRLVTDTCVQVDHYSVKLMSLRPSPHGDDLRHICGYLIKYDHFSDCALTCSKTGLSSWKLLLKQYSFCLCVD